MPEEGEVGSHDLIRQKNVTSLLQDSSCIDHIVKADILNHFNEFSHSQVKVKKDVLVSGGQLLDNTWTRLSY